MMETLYCAVDLHSNNGYYGIVNKSGNRIWSKRLPNELDDVLKHLQPYKNQLATIAVESTYNWYWLVDGLQNNGFKDKVAIANPAKMDQYSGMKNSNDKSDAFFIAELMRLEILPTGYICDKESRAVRDILRRRSLFVKQCTAQKLSLQNMVSRQCGQTMSMREMHKLTDDEWTKILVSKDNFFMARQNVDMIRFLTEKIKMLEKHVLKQAKLKPEFEKLLTVPGIGNILGLTIMYETCDISRFAKAGNFTSYCRCVKAEAQSNGKKKGQVS